MLALEGEGLLLRHLDGLHVLGVPRLTDPREVVTFHSENNHPITHSDFQVSQSPTPGGGVPQGLSRGTVLVDADLLQEPLAATRLPPITQIPFLLHGSNLQNVWQVHDIRINTEAMLS